MQTTPQTAWTSKTVAVHKIEILSDISFDELNIENIVKIKIDYLHFVNDLVTFYEPWSWAIFPGCSCMMLWPYSCFVRGLSWFLHLHLNKLFLNIRCSSRAGSGSFLCSIRGRNQKPSLSSWSLSQACPSFFHFILHQNVVHVFEKEALMTVNACSLLTQRAVRDVLSHLACFQNTFFRFHTSLRAVSAALFSWTLGCAFKNREIQKISLDLTHWGTNGKAPDMALPLRKWFQCKTV